MKKDDEFHRPFFVFVIMQVKCILVLGIIKKAPKRSLFYV